MTKQELLQKLVEAGAQFGYFKQKRNPSTKPFIYTTKGSKDIIDLDKTVEQIEKAAEFLVGIVKNKKQFLIVGTKPEARERVTNAGLKMALPYAAERFIGGSLTNFGEIKRRVEKLHDLIAKKEAGEFSVYTKKEQVLIDRDIARMTKNFGGLSQISGLPAAVFLIDTNHEHIALAEAKYMRLPVVAIANTDCNIKGTDYPIVMNDASANAITVVLDYLAQKVEAASE
jgi:small subunit ribosomal protein S2